MKKIIVSILGAVIAALAIPTNSLGTEVISGGPGGPHFHRCHHHHHHHHHHHIHHIHHLHL